jgi:hypothetical protein
LDFQEKTWGGGEYYYQFANLPVLEIKNKEIKLLAENFGGLEPHLIAKEKLNQNHHE